MTDFDSAIRRAAGYPPEADEPAPPGDLDLGVRSSSLSAPAPGFDAVIDAERALRTRERGDLARHYDRVARDPSSLGGGR